MCYHKASPQKADLADYLQSLEMDVIIDDYDFYWHANGFNHPQMPVMTLGEPHRVQTFMWGMVPVFAKHRTDAKSWAGRMLNATCEKAGSTFKPYFQKQRCLVFVSGFFEWQWMDPKGKTKTPWFIHRENGRPFAMGGIYNHWTDRETGEVFSTYSVVTTPANALMEQIHNTKKRMPLVLPEESWSEWLNPEKMPVELLVPAPDEYLRAHQVSKDLSRRGIDTNQAYIQEAVTVPGVAADRFLF